MYTTYYKNYALTNAEILVIRDALIEYWQQIKNLKPDSPHAIKAQKICLSLKEQFEGDALRKGVDL